MSGLKTVDLMLPASTEALSKLEIGSVAYLTGRVFTAREGVYKRAHDNVKALVSDGERISAKKLNQHQLAAHAVAYLATELEACRQLADWAARRGTGARSGAARSWWQEIAGVLNAPAGED